jgi:apolipoprotein N-acyltransferase
MHDLPALAHRFRCAGALVAWGLLALATPGMVVADGLPLVAALGVAVWAHVEARPYKGRAWKGFLAHALGALPGAAATMLWIRFVYPPPLAYIGFGIGCYSAAGGVLLRRLLALRGPRALAPLAVALAWTAQDTLRAWVPMPFGVEWMRFGVHAHAWLPLAESVRVWGVSGLGFALAALGGWAAYAYRARRGALAPAAVAAGLAPALVGLALGALTAAPETVAGPRVLVVQPGFSQARKQHDDPDANFAALCEATRDALESERAAGRPAPDLVAWGESMLYQRLFEPDVSAHVARDGADGDRRPTEIDLARLALREEDQVRGRILGAGRFAKRHPRPVLPPGTSFLAGAEVYVAHGGEVRRSNAAVVYDAEGRRSRSAGKRFLVPGAETMYGLQRLEPVEAFIRDVADYVPDLLASTETGVLPLTTRGGERYALATSICFDNAHLAAFTDPVAREDVDLHVVVSNEAWYQDSFEVDQMVAFTRLGALATGRAVVRATNSGISLVMGPDGRELGRITAGGKDRMVAGHLALDVPVPAAGDAAPAPPIVRLRAPLDALWVAVPIVMAVLGALGGRGGARAGGRFARSSGAAGNPPSAAG